jgi:hypothetical protein
MAADYEEWSSCELAGELENCDKFMEEELGHWSEEKLETLELWQWDRYDLTQYAIEYLNPDDYE